MLHQFFPVVDGSGFRRVHSLPAACGCGAPCPRPGLFWRELGLSRPQWRRELRVPPCPAGYAPQQISTLVPGDVAVNRVRLSWGLRLCRVPRPGVFCTLITAHSLAASLTKTDVSIPKVWIIGLLAELPDVELCASTVLGRKSLWGCLARRVSSEHMSDCARVWWPGSLGLGRLEDEAG